MSGIAPEPADRAIARIYAAGLYDPAGLLDPTYRVESRAAHTVEWDRDTRRWHASAG